MDDLSNRGRTLAEIDHLPQTNCVYPFVHQQNSFCSLERQDV
jgi:hypothetical protein